MLKLNYDRYKIERKQEEELKECNPDTCLITLKNNPLPIDPVWLQKNRGQYRILLQIIDKSTNIPRYGYIWSQEQADEVEQIWKKSLNPD